MGIFKSFATSGFGDFSTGALRGIAEQGVADAHPYGSRPFKRSDYIQKFLTLTP